MMADARKLAEAGAAVLMEESSLTGALIAKTLLELRADPAFDRRSGYSSHSMLAAPLLDRKGQAAFSDAPPGQRAARGGRRIRSPTQGSMRIDLGHAVRPFEDCLTAARRESTQFIVTRNARSVEPNRRAGATGHR